MEIEAAVRQTAEAMVEILVDRAGEDRVRGGELVAQLADSPSPRATVDVAVIEHVLEHGGVAIQRHRLERVEEVAVVGRLVRVGTRAVTDLSSSEGSSPHCLRV